MKVDSHASTPSSSDHLPFSPHSSRDGDGHADGGLSDGSDDTDSPSPSTPPPPSPSLSHPPSSSHPPDPKPRTDQRKRQHQKSDKQRRAKIKTVWSSSRLSSPPMAASTPLTRPPSSRPLSTSYTPSAQRSLPSSPTSTAPGGGPGRTRRSGIARRSTRGRRGGTVAAGAAVAVVAAQQSAAGLGWGHGMQGLGGLNPLMLQALGLGGGWGWVVGAGGESDAGYGGYDLTAAVDDADERWEFCEWAVDAESARVGHDGRLWQGVGRLTATVCTVGQAW